MTTPHVTEVRRALEPVSPDPFVEDLEQDSGPSGEPPPSPALVLPREQAERRK
jgi:hypothetical protein